MNSDYDNCKYMGRKWSIRKSNHLSKFRTKNWVEVNNDASDSKLTIIKRKKSYLLSLVPVLPCSYVLTLGVIQRCTYQQLHNVREDKETNKLL